MAKILISSLGTGVKKEGGYKIAKYEYNGEIEETTFISKALAKFLQIDKLFLVGTKGSIWDSCYNQFGGNDEDVELSLLEKVSDKTIESNDLDVINQTIDKFNGNVGSKCFLIDYGVNDEELWNNFDKYLEILNLIQDDDILYIDISHSFRSLALMSFIMVQFGHIIKDKKFKIGGIFYGMLEYSSENKGITPIVDLKIFYDLMEWIKAVDTFKNYANADLMASLLQNDFKNEYKIFNNFTSSLRIGNMSALKQSINTMHKKIDILKNSKNPIISLMSTEIIKLIDRLNKEKQSDFQLELAAWHYENKNYALSYIALIESIVTKVCEIENLDINDKDTREQVKKRLRNFNRKLFDIYNPANRVRKNIAHQLDNRTDTIVQDIKNLKNYLSKLKNIYREI
jgi:CRISPR-associated Csx2 family protein